LFRDGIRVSTHGLLADNRQLHHLDLYTHKVEADFAKDAILQVERILRKLEFNMQTLFDTDLHLDGNALTGTLADVLHNELFFLRDPIVIPVDHDVDIVSQSYDDTVVALKLLFNTIEGKVIGHVVRESARWLKVTY